MATKKKTGNGKRGELGALDEHEIRAVAAAAKVDPRTVARALRGAPRQSGVVKAAIVSALRDRGHALHAAAVEGGAS